MTSSRHPLELLDGTIVMRVDVPETKVGAVTFKLTINRFTGTFSVHWIHNFICRLSVSYPRPENATELLGQPTTPTLLVAEPTKALTPVNGLRVYKLSPEERQAYS